MAMGIAVELAGQTMAAGYDGIAPVVVDGVEFTWGRSRLFDQTDPGVAKLSLIDRTGEWASRRDLNGQRVTIRRTNPNRAMFVGTISGAKARRVIVRNPVNLSRESVWQVDLVASSVLADVAQAVLTGSSTENSREGLGGWAEDYSRQRLRRKEYGLISRGALELLPGDIQAVGPIDNEVAPGVMPRQASVDASKGATVLELIEQVYRTVGMYSVEFDPETIGVFPGGFAKALGFSLVRTGGRVVLQLPGGRMVPAQLVGVPSGYEAESTVSESIDAVQMTYEYYTKDPTLSAGQQVKYAWLSQLLQRNTAKTGTRTRRILKVDSGLITLDPTLFNDNTYTSKINAGPPWCLSTIVNIVNQTNGQMRMPPLLFDERRMPLNDAGLVEQVYSPVTSAVPLYFTGSVFNTLGNAGPQHQIIGGTFRYIKGGWTHTATVGPALAGTLTPLTLVQLVGRSTAPLSSYDPSITLADLQLVTTGLTS